MRLPFIGNLNLEPELEKGIEAQERARTKASRFQYGTPVALMGVDYNPVKLCISCRSVLKSSNSLGTEI